LEELYAVSINKFISIAHKTDFPQLKPIVTCIPECVQTPVVCPPSVASSL
jgi:hypothetical protein